jgi:subtilisin family serine protease
VVGADISATKAWDVSKGSSGNVVAIIDSGISPGHQDLAANIWSAPHAFTVTVGGVQHTCATGSQGFDTLDKPESCNNSDLADTSNGHGTAMAGIIGAIGNNSIGVSGVNWIARMMIVRAISTAGTLDVADAVDGIDFVVKAKLAGVANVRVINASWEQTNPDIYRHNPLQ